KILPIVRELAHMRLQLRHGQGKHVLDQTRGLCVRALELVNEIRAQTWSALASLDGNQKV
ncbi:MAG TPA: hypothetical protein PKW60_11900, partial [Candidatus Hydrogenedentes bacterium]|nr:hypothetical protein [Candidatus Hydrogenedentota bacterium]